MQGVKVVLPAPAPQVSASAPEDANGMRDSPGERQGLVALLPQAGDVSQGFFLAAAAPALLALSHGGRLVS